MEAKELINDSIKSCEKSVSFFSNSGRPDREKWVVREFLKNLGINFENSELKTGNNPPDVIFRAAEFEIKEVDEKGRRRHDEYKQELEKTKSATILKHLNKPFKFKNITLEQIIYRIDEEIEKLNYSLDFCKKTNILFYINYSLIKEHCHTISAKNKWKKWCSVSMITNNNISYVFWVNDGAPEFIKSIIGEVII